jgi:hypothetical protein
VGDQLAGGIVGVAEKDRVVPGKGRSSRSRLGAKPVSRFGQEKIGLDIVHPAAVGIVGIGRADDQHPPGGQGGAGGIDELGGAAAGQDPLRLNPEQGGDGLDRRPAVDLGQHPDAVETLRDDRSIRAGRQAD